MRFQDRIAYLQTKAEYWQTRGQNAAERHEHEMREARTRISELEQKLAEIQSRETVGLQEPKSTEMSDETVKTDSGQKYHAVKASLSTLQSLSKSSFPGQECTGIVLPDQHDAQASSSTPSHLPVDPWTQISKHNGEPMQQLYGSDSLSISPSVRHSPSSQLSAVDCPANAYDPSQKLSLPSSSNGSPRGGNSGHLLSTDSQAELLKMAMKNKSRKLSIFKNAAALWTKAGKFRGTVDE